MRCLIPSPIPAIPSIEFVVLPGARPAEKDIRFWPGDPGLATNRLHYCVTVAPESSRWNASARSVAQQEPALTHLNSSVLVVDDYGTMRRIIRNLLTQIGFTNIDEAPDGATALGKLRERSFGLVISDWNMEPMTGLQLLQEVRADSKLKPLPFIMVTAESKTENVVAAKQAGVSNYIIKPFNADTLKKKIESVLGSL